MFSGNGFSKNKIAAYLIEVAELFGKKGKETIICKAFGKQVLEVELILKHCSEKCKILDVGGGAGINLLCLSKINKRLELHLVDNFKEHSDEHTTASREHILQLLKKFGISVNVQDFWEKPVLPYDSNSFEIVTVFDVIEHFPEPPFKLLGEIKRILKKNGTLIGSVPNLVSTARRGRMFLGRHPYIHFDEWISGKYYGHYRECTREEWQIIIEKSGFTRVKTFMVSEPTKTKAFNSYHDKKYNKFSLPSLGLWSLYFLDFIFPNLRTAIYFTAHPEDNE